MNHSTPIRFITKRLLILLIILQITRIIFYFSNQSNFYLITLNDVLASFYFDIVTVVLYSAPFIFLTLIPFDFRNYKIYQWFLVGLFHLIFILLLALNLIDIEYFRFTQKRSTSDLFTLVGTGKDFSQQLSSFFADFWLLLVFFLFFYILFIIWERKQKYFKTYSSKFKNSFVFIFGIILSVIISRGGFSLKPVSPIDASKYTRIEHNALVLNTPFTILKSYNKGGLEEFHYLSKKEEKKLFNPIQVTNPQNLYSNQKNVFIIILESFGNEWVGASGSKKSFTPFLDSLTNHSLYFVNGIANGKKSIEAVPSIVSSLPSLMDNPYISSSYGNNKVESIARILKKHQYTSAFFHGATNGSMRFDGFASQAGFDKYFGRKEYNNDEHSDQAWGILDEYFNPWSAQMSSQFKTPFFSVLFTLSSHHPYFIPPHMKGKLKKGPHPICQSINYGDYALKKFFEQAKKEKWYSNTIFVICADHTSSSNTKKYNQRTEVFKIPILFFDPEGKLPIKKEEKIFQQMDIFPTLLDLLNINAKFYSFGSSYFKNNEKYALTYLEGTYHLFFDNYLLTFSNNKAQNLYNHSNYNKNMPDSLRFYQSKVRQKEMFLKAIIQRYNHDLIFNQTTLEKMK
ncbi:MAG: LTA synthase family protein [Flavobacteriia bacterium]|nr:LTA synthase family protein [Flavobacteriia bacterium]